MSSEGSRKAVRKLLERLDTINAQRMSFALALARRAEADSSLLAVWDEAEKIAEEEIMPAIRKEEASLYAALDSPDGDWETEIEKVLGEHE